MLSLRRGAALLKLGRVSNLPTLVSNVTVGYVLAGGHFQDGVVPIVLCLVTVVCFYEAGMFLNDVLDYSIDCRERPERPIPLGLVSLKLAVFIVLGLFFTGLTLTALFLPQNLVLSLVLVTLIVIYNQYHTRWLLAPFLLGACRSCVYLMAAQVISTKGLGKLGPVGPMALGLGFYISAVSFIARDEVKKSLGRLQKYSIAAVMGILLWPLLFAEHRSFILLLGFLPLLGWLGFTEVQLIQKKIAAPKAVGSMLAGISLWDAFVLTTVPSLAGAFLAWFCFGGARLWQRRIQSS